MTKEELFAASELHIDCVFEVGPRGGIHEQHHIWHITKIKTWKRDPDRFDVTLHRGLKLWDHITNMSDLKEGHVFTEKTCPALLESKIHSFYGMSNE